MDKFDTQVVALPIVYAIGFLHGFTTRYIAFLGVQSWKDAKATWKAIRNRSR